MAPVIPAIVYILCLATSITCAGLLGRMYWRNGMRLLLWSAVCFACLALNNFVVILDMLVFPNVDLQVVRLGLSLAAVSVLLFGFTWDIEE
ncbi:MAG: hypothetical protein EOP13_12415 [Pseudomonas sp.]|uniref:DUF5985 family protein n=1 Tax=Pseudomonas sp. TaxID=306 RepID=UPI0012237423|nr:DUF5985 family protein [Pseudomonas sp.]RZI73310.1 MAG: hypothetical protein EOP13_12415 [Pseudomonas sp.]